MDFTSRPPPLKDPCLIVTNGFSISRLEKQEWFILCVFTVIENLSNMPKALSPYKVLIALGPVATPTHAVQVLPGYLMVEW